MGRVQRDIKINVFVKISPIWRYMYGMACIGISHWPRVEKTSSTIRIYARGKANVYNQLKKQHKSKQICYMKKVAGDALYRLV